MHCQSITALNTLVCRHYKESQVCEAHTHTCSVGSLCRKCIPPKSFGNALHGFNTLNHPTHTIPTNQSWMQSTAGLWLSLLPTNCTSQRPSPTVRELKGGMKTHLRNVCIPKLTGTRQASHFSTERINNSIPSICRWILTIQLYQRQLVSSLHPSPSSFSFPLTPHPLPFFSSSPPFQQLR